MISDRDMKPVETCVCLQREGHNIRTSSMCFVHHLFFLGGTRFFLKFPRCVLLNLFVCLVGLGWSGWVGLVGLVG